MNPSIPLVFTPRHLTGAKWVAVGVWTFAVAASLVWSARLLHETMIEAAVTDARNGFSMASLYLVNPAYMTRQVEGMTRKVHNLRAQDGDVLGHITSLKPSRPENAPDAWEAAALRSFERGQAEVVTRQRRHGRRYVRFMKPLVTKAACLKCHGGQGYRVGDIRGGISVTVPIDPLLDLAQAQLWPIAGAHAGLWVLGVLGILLSARQVRQRLDKQLRAEEALQENESLLKESQIIAGLGSYVLDIPNGRWKSSDVLDKVFGIAEAYDRSVEGWAALIQPSDRTMMTDYFANEVLGGGRRFDKEYRIIRQDDGAERWVHGLGKLEFDAEGRPVLMHGTIQDISERKQAEAAIASERALLRTVVDNIPMAVYLKDSDGCKVLANAVDLSNIGRPESEVLGRTDIELFPKELAERLMADDRSVIRDGVCVVDREELITSASGESRWLLTSKIPWRNSEGDVVGLVGIGHDITQRKRTEDALRSSEARTRAITDSAENAILMMDPKGAITYWNPAAARIFGYSREEAMGKNLHALIVPRRYHAAHHAAYPAFLRTGRGAVIGQTLEMQACRKNGSEVAVDLSLSSVQIDGVWHAVGIIRDITKRKEAENSLRLHSAAINAANDLIAILNHDGEIVFSNDAFHRQIGYSPAEIVGRKLFDLWPQAKSDRCGHEAEAALGSRIAWNGEIRCGMRDGSGFEADITITPLPDDAAHRDHAVVVARNITERKAAEGLLLHQAHHDALTGLPNRLHFSQRLALVIMDHDRKRKRCAALFIDIDNFKLVNDTMGHPTGDALLVQVAERLSLCMREGDLLARMGGDEFTVLLENLRFPDDIERITQRILEQLSQPFEIAGTRLVIGASIGTATYPEDATNGVALLKSADAAMYRAKARGRNNCQFFSEEMGQANATRVELERDLRLAVERNELEVFYQPIVDVRTMRIEGAEALLRWNHPKKGMISPSLFIPVAEETGLIVNLGLMVLETASRQCREWNDMGYTGFEVSVNVSPVQMRSKRFRSDVAAILSKTGLSPRCLNLEITETLLAGNDCGEIDALGELREQGIMCSLDDFGIGYSSLSRLKDFPISHLKVDGAFIRDIEHNSRDRAMTESIITMAHNLGIKVTAEWIENEEQLATVRWLECDYAQGYLFSPAAPAEKMGKLLREWSFAQLAVDAV